MRLAYVDSSCIVAIALVEADHQRVASWLYGFDHLYSSNLLEAELRSAMAREKVGSPADMLLSAITWVLPERSFAPEYELALKHGDLRGADLWHLACALYLKDELSEIAFLSVDERQTTVAASLGFTAE